MNPILTSIIFIITYILILMFRKYSLQILAISILMLFLTGMSLNQIFQSINFNVLGVFLGTMILSALFIYSEFPVFLAEKLIKNTNKTYIALLLICGLSAGISMFTENIATVLIVAPIALAICDRLKINPTFVLIGISIASNLEGTSTLIGDAPSIILAMKTGMNFNDFFWMNSKPGLFFAIQFATIGAFFVLYLFFKKYNQPCEYSHTPTKVKTWVPTILFCLMTIHLAIEPFLPFHSSLAMICIFWALIAMIWYVFEKSEKIAIAKDLDWFTLFFLTGIFILVNSLIISGVVDILADFIYNLSNGSILKSYIIIIIFSVIISAFVDNIPYTIAMLPVAQEIATKTNTDPFLLIYGLMIGTCLGGNITPIGSASNVVTMGILRKNNIDFKTSDFIKLGLPFTLVAVLMGAFFIWWFYK